MEGPEPRREGPSPWTSYAVYGSAGIQLAVAVIAGYWVGQYVDGKCGTGPWLGVAGITLGFVGGLLNLVRIVGVLTKERSKGEKG